MNRFFYFLVMCFSTFFYPSFALTVETTLADSAKEAQARALFKEIRCVVCQSESIADSPADVARDMRKLIRDQLAGGKKSEDILSMLRSRYGDQILMTPPLKPATYALWFGPMAILFLSLMLVFFYFRKPRS